MKTKSLFIKSMSMMATFLMVFIACNTSQDELPTHENAYEIASPNYAVLAEKSLDLLAGFELESFAMMLSDDVAYEFPDGRQLFGKVALINYWQNYKNTSGIKSMKIMNANYLPINIHSNPKGDGNSGVKVIANFTNIITFYSKNISVKMNFNFHFNKDKMIDRIITYYDRTPIIEASGKNYIQKTKP